MLHLKKCLIRGPISGKSVVRIMNLFVVDLFGTGGTELEQRVLTRLRGNPSWFGRLEWCDLHTTKNSLEKGSSIWTVHWSQSRQRLLMSWKRSQWNETRKRPPLHSCNAFKVQKFSVTDELVAEQDTVSMLLHFFFRCASMATFGFPDASYRNNKDGSSQRYDSDFNRFWRWHGH